MSNAALRIALVRSRFNTDVCEGLERECLARLAELGLDPAAVARFDVPGALEIPLVLRQLAATGQYDALVALGAVIRGETYHFEVVSNESAAGVMRVSLDYGIPVANAILTCDSDEQAEARVVEKGRDAADVAVEMAHMTRQIQELANQGSVTP